MTRWLAIALLLLGCRTASVQERESPTPAPAAAPPGRIAFVSDRGGQHQVYELSLADDAIASTTVAGQAFAGPVAPDGRGIVAISVSDDGEHRETLWWLDGGGAHRALAMEAGRVRNPAWMPDGSALVVEASRDGFRDLYRVPVDGSPAERLTDDESSFEPDVHPRGGRVAFTSTREGQSDIYSLDLATRQVHKLSWSRFIDMSPRWSPDGEHIAYISHRNGVPRIWWMKQDGSAPRALTDLSTDAIEQGEAVWSPSGDALAFVEHFRDHSAIRIVDRSGRTLSRTNADARDREPTWSPDGRWIAFASDRDDNQEIYAMRRDGGDMRRLTRNDAADTLPRWLR